MIDGGGRGPVTASPAGGVGPARAGDEEARHLALVGDVGPTAITAPPPAPDAAPPAIDAGIDAPKLAMVDAPIAWPPERDAAMLAYRRLHTDPAATDTTITPKMIVLHYTAGGSAKGTKAYFDNLHMEKSRAKLASGGDVNVSAHFLVDRDGTIYKLMPEDRMARHAIGVNHVAIGVENVGDEDKWPLTAAQVAADAALIRDLKSRWPIEILLGHHEVRGLDGTPWIARHDVRIEGRARRMPAPAHRRRRRLSRAAKPGTQPAPRNR